MVEITLRKITKRGTNVDVGIGKRTVVKRVKPSLSRVLNIHEQMMREYGLLVKARVPVAKVYRVVSHKFRVSEKGEPVVVQQKAENIPPLRSSNTREG